MRSYFAAAAAIFGIAIAALELGGTAHAAAPTGGSNAADAVNQLCGQTHTVRVGVDTAFRSVK